MTGPRHPQDVAVFTRNWQHYLEQARALSQRNHRRIIVFRSRSKWATAHREIPAGGSLPVYIAVNRGPGVAKYQAELCDVLIKPGRKNPRTRALLASVLKKTRHEDLWEKTKKGPVKTLYAIRACRRLPRPSPITSLVKLSDGKPISETVGRTPGADPCLS